MFIYTTQDAYKSENMKMLQKNLHVGNCKYSRKTGTWTFSFDMNDEGDVPQPIMHLVDGDPDWTSDFYYES